MTFKYYKQYRLPEFDYSSNNVYFITICTKNYENSFGNILNSEMQFSEIGIFAKDLLSSVNGKLDYLRLLSFTVMPNHVHFLAIINNSDHQEVELKKGLHPLVKKSISSFTNHFKGKVKRWCNENGFEDFAWLDRFRDRVVRDYDELMAIDRYIEENIKTWETDPENPASPNFGKD